MELYHVYSCVTCFFTHCFWDLSKCVQLEGIPSPCCMVTLWIYHNLFFYFAPLCVIPYDVFLVLVLHVDFRISLSSSDSTNLFEIVNGTHWICRSVLGKSTSAWNWIFQLIPFDLIADIVWFHYFKFVNVFSVAQNVVSLGECPCELEENVCSAQWMQSRCRLYPVDWWWCWAPWKDTTIKDWTGDKKSWENNSILKIISVKSWKIKISQKQNKKTIREERRKPEDHSCSLWS